MKQKMKLVALIALFVLAKVSLLGQMYNLNQSRTPQHIFAKEGLPFLFAPTPYMIYEKNFNQYVDVELGLYLQAGTFETGIYNKSTSNILIHLDLDAIRTDSIKLKSKQGNAITIWRYYPKRYTNAISAVVEYKLNEFSMFITILQINGDRKDKKRVKHNYVEDVLRSIIIDSLTELTFLPNLEFKFPKEVTERVDKSGFIEYSHVEIKPGFPWIISYKVPFKPTKEGLTSDLVLAAFNKYLIRKADRVGYMGVVQSPNFTFQYFSVDLIFKIQSNELRIPIELFCFLKDDFLYCIQFYRYKPYDDFLGDPKRVLKSTYLVKAQKP